MSGLTRIEGVAPDPRDHLGLVFKAAQDLSTSLRCDRDELLGDAYLAMCEAIRTFKPEKGFRFSTHAVPAVRFRLYALTMQACGKRRTRIRCTTDAAALRRGRDVWVQDEHPSEHVAELARTRKSADPGPDRDRMAELLRIAEEVSPNSGPQCIRLLARGVPQERASKIVGKKHWFAKWLLWQIRLRLSGERRIKEVGHG